MENKKIEEIVKNLTEYKNEKEVEFMSHYGNGNDKSLRITLNGSFRVYEKKELIFETLQPFSAVEKYLSIKPKKKEH